MAKKKKRKNKRPFGILFWIAIIFLIATIAALNIPSVKEKIRVIADENNPNSTNNSSANNSATSTASSNQNNSSGNNSSNRINTDNNQHNSQGSQNTTTSKPDQNKNSGKKTNTNNNTTDKNNDSDMIRISINTGSDKKEPVQTKTVKLHKEYIATLYFLAVKDNEDTYLKKVDRKIKYKDSPLTKTLETIITGLTADQITEGLLNFIPENTKLISASVKNEIAYLNFSKEFIVDQFGEIGAKAKLMQIVYTATEFPTISRVQILIEGEKTKYINAEGVDISKPLSRTSF